MSNRLLDRRELLACLSGILVGGCESRQRDAGTIIVGSSATGVPFSFVDPWTNQLTGAMIDTLRAVTERAGLPIELRTTPFSALIPSLLARKIDMIAAAMLRTQERERIVAFSEPVFAYSGGLAVPRNDTRRYPSLRELRQLRVGAQVGTRFVDQVKAAGIERVLTYDNLSAMLRDLSHGRIDAAYGDAPILRYQLHVGPRRGVRMVQEFVAPAQEELCFVMRQGEALLPRIDAAIAALRHSRIPAIVRHWNLV